MTDKTQTTEQTAELNAAQKIHEQIGLIKVFPLKKPIPTPLGEVNQVTARLVMVEDYEKAAIEHPENGALQQLYVMCIACGLTREDFRKMAWADYQKIRSFCTED